MSLAVQSDQLNRKQKTETKKKKPRVKNDAESVALQHAVDKVAKRTPVITPACQAVFINEEHVLLEAGV